MKRKIFQLIVLGFFVLFFAPAAFAENVQVVGRVDNPTTNTSGSRVDFKDASSQQVISTTTVDPAGVYSVSVPAGTYDIVVVPPAGSNLKSITKSNQEIMSNTESNVTLPSSNPFSSQIPGNILYVAAAGVILVLLVWIGIVLLKKNSK